ncbi:voltage-gated potassium channel [Balnearium lithotrophicum]|uniref:Voltage-gated potassium channel n=1 Tax=Balnearium lithotrophicum TaxID=223788 RepID=A0A521DER6_9BACT|nr:potassium channel protein [Balnearium lithotrophicum]SMO70126.1 voltage-gated potassium channel [Balnearium lithotrophicum]
MATVKLTKKFLKQEINSILVLILVLLSGTIGYGKLDNWNHSIIDYLYMTFITISTIGYEEVIPLSTPEARLFTIAISVVGIGTFGYIFSKLTAFLFDPINREIWKEEKMREKIKKMKNHIIVYGNDVYLLYLIEDLINSNLEFVLILENKDLFEKIISNYPNYDFNYFISETKIIKDVILKNANVEKARGLVAISDDDSKNLYISIACRYLNPKIKIIARCLNPEFIQKCKFVGIDYPISLDYISAKFYLYKLIKPYSVDIFLDLFSKSFIEKKHDIDEIEINKNLEGKAIIELGLKNFSELIIVALVREGKVIINPSRQMLLRKGDVLIVYGSKEELRRFKSSLKLLSFKLK